MSPRVIEISAQLVRYEPDLRMAPHADGCRRLSVVVGGEQHEYARDGSAHARVGSVALKHAEFEHHNAFGSRGATILSVLLEERVLVALGHRPEALVDGCWQHDGTPAVLGLGLAAALRRGDGADAARRLAALLGGFARDAQGAARSPARAGAPDPRALRVARRLAAAPVERPPSLGELADAEGLHPASLDRVFRRSHGCAITTWRQRERVRAVARELLDGERPLVQIALHHGFADLSHMSRVFRREVGLAPGRFRAVLRALPRGLGTFKTSWRLTA